jgi:hypothetical protein
MPEMRHYVLSAFVLLLFFSGVLLVKYYPFWGAVFFSIFGISILWFFLAFTFELAEN